MVALTRSVPGVPSHGDTEGIYEGEAEAWLPGFPRFYTKLTQPP